MNILSFNNKDLLKNLIRMFKDNKCLYVFSINNQLVLLVTGIFTVKIFFNKDEFTMNNSIEITIDPLILIHALSVFSTFQMILTDEIIFINDSDITDSMDATNHYEKIYKLTDHDTQIPLTKNFILEHTKNYIVAPFLERQPNSTQPTLNSQPASETVVEFSIDAKLLSYFNNEKTRYSVGDQLILTNTADQREENTFIKIMQIKKGFFEFTSHNKWVPQIHSVKSYIESLVFKIYESKMNVFGILKTNKNVYIEIEVLHAIQ